MTTLACVTKASGAWSLGSGASGGEPVGTMKPAVAPLLLAGRWLLESVVVGSGRRSYTTPALESDGPDVSGACDTAAAVVVKAVPEEAAGGYTMAGPPGCEYDRALDPMFWLPRSGVCATAAAVCAATAWACAAAAWAAAFACTCSSTRSSAWACAWAARAACAACTACAACA